MSSLELLAAAADGWLAWAWRAALVSAGVLAVLLVTRPLTRRVLSAHASSWLWLLPVVPLVVPPLYRAPVEVPLPEPPALERLVTTLSFVAPAPSETPTHGEGVAPVGDEPRDAREPVELASATPATPAGTIELRHALVFAWWAIAATLLVVTVVRQARVFGLLRRASPPADRALARRFHSLAREAGVDGVRLLETERLASPVTLGLLRSRVLLPRGLADELEPAALDWILRHELAHVRRRDVPVEACLRVVRALWPFHPATWVAPSIAEAERELACDAAALAGARPDDGPRAARALLHVLERGRSHAACAALAVPFVHPPSLERRRIMNLLDAERAVSRGLSPFARFGLAVATLALVPLAAQAPGAVDPPVVTGTQVGPPLVVTGTAADPPLVVTGVEVDARESSGLPFVGKLFGRTVEKRTDREGVIASACAYLIARQHADGRWLASATRESGGIAGELDDVGVTGSVILALLDGPADVAGRGEAIRAGLTFLAGREHPDHGAFVADPPTFVQLPSHFVALTAWIRAHRELDLVRERPDWRDRAQRGIDAIYAARNPYGAWRYDLPPVGDNDSVMTGLALHALAAARDAGFEVDPRAIEGAENWFQEVFDTETGRIGYGARGQATSRIVGKKDAFPGDAVETPTAVALSAWLAWGADPLVDDGMIQAAVLLSGKAPAWSIGKGTIDSYYWAYGTRAMRSFGGVLADRWNASLEQALLRRADRDDAGRHFWEAIDAWHFEGSEVAMTAMCVRALAALEGAPVVTGRAGAGR